MDLSNPPQRRSFTRAFALTALAVVLVVASRPVNAQDHGVIIGTVVNGTAGAAIPTGLEVTLFSRRGSEPLPLRTTTVEPDGTFTFAELPTVPDVAYFAELTHGGVTYVTEGIQLDAASAAAATLTVFETTGRDPGISFLSVSRLLQRQTSDAITVLDVIEVSTPGDRTLLPFASSAAPSPLRFAVPDGAFALQSVSGFGPDELVIGGPGFAVMAPLRPGATTIVYAYQLRLDGGEATFEWLIGLSAETVRLLSEQAALEIDPGGLPPRGSESFGELAVEVWEAKDVAARTSFVISVADTSLPGIARAIRATTAGHWALFAAGGGLLISLALATRHRIWCRRPPLDDFARACQLLDELQQGSPHDATERSLLREELIDLIERRPTIAAELRRDRSAGEGGPTA